MSFWDWLLLLAFIVFLIATGFDMAGVSDLGIGPK
jgi:hypothetical protein